MTLEETHQDAIDAAHEWRDEQRDPYGANAMDEGELAKLYAGLVAEAIAAGRTCELCPEPAAEIVLNYEVEHLLCAVHAEKARVVHLLQLEFWGGDAEPGRILRWHPDRGARHARLRQQHLR